MTSAVPLFFAQAVNVAADFLGPVKRVFDSHWYILGKEVAGFEREFAEYRGVANYVCVASGTGALDLGLRALDVKTDENVIVAANAGLYTRVAVRFRSANGEISDQESGGGFELDPQGDSSPMSETKNENHRDGTLTV